jgi:hypothetical protein
MEKYLFTDGTNGVREVQSQEELQELIRSVSQTDAIQIWIFNCQEWITYAAFCKQNPAFHPKERSAVTIKTEELITRPANGKRWLKKFLFFIAAAAGVFLVFNFTKIKWEKSAPLVILAEKPVNVPVMDIDSLIDEIEYDRGEHLDRTTKMNLRIRNTWPDRIQLQLNSDKDISSAGSRFYNMEISIDNSTGYNIDNALVGFTIWRDNKVNSTDTVQFSNISFAGVTKRNVTGMFRGDSISLSFQSIKAKAFNFCYSSSAKNNSGNYNDRWFCSSKQ